MELAVFPVEAPWASRGTEAQEDRLPPIVVTGHPHTYTAASHHAETLGAEERVDRRKVVADDATGQLELARDRLDGRRSGLGQQHACDARLPAIERNYDRHRAPNLNPLFPRLRRPAPREHGHRHRIAIAAHTRFEKVAVPVTQVGDGAVGALQEGH